MGNATLLSEVRSTQNFFLTISFPFYFKNKKFSGCITKLLDALQNLREVSSGCITKFEGSCFEGEFTFLPVIQYALWIKIRFVYASKLNVLEVANFEEKYCKNAESLY